jgi:UDP-glucose:(heptosyl)LPS alpha-1,3-glucosyltransferase
LATKVSLPTGAADTCCLIEGGVLPPITVVAHVVGVAPGTTRQGGTEIQVSALVEGYLAMGGDVTLICERTTLTDHPRLRVLRVRTPGRPFLVNEPWFILRASVAVARHRRGLVHQTGAVVLAKADLSTVHFCHTAYARSALPGRARRATPVRRLSAWAAARMAVAMERWCFRPSHTRVLVTPSEGGASDLARHFPALVAYPRIIHNGIDRQRFLAADAPMRAEVRDELHLPPEALAAIFVGGDWNRKQLRTAIEAMADAPGWHLLVVGAGDDRTYRAIAEDHGLADRVHFLGVRGDVERLYGASDAFVFPSRYEVAPLVVYEAAASGLPLLVSKINGTEELIEPGANGWFVSGPAEIAKALRMLAADPALRDRMSAAARQSSQSYTWPSMVERYAELYVELMISKRCDEPPRLCMPSSASSTSTAE